jgi:hypothetical protein
VDFNLVYKNQDKNNYKVSRNMMLWFERVINHLQIKEVNLIGKRFTWSNESASKLLINFGD